MTIDRDGTTVPATLLHPRGRAEPLPAWVMLHGITRPGRAHEQLIRFARVVASTGTVVIVPEVPEWRELDLAPHLTRPTLKAAIAGLRSTDWARDAPVGVIGFSFGAQHVIAATGHPDVCDNVAGSVGFGGYCDLGRTIHFMMTGWHECDGQPHQLTPDPYGRWIVGANYIASVPGHEGATDVAEALATLAAHAGDAGVPSWDPVHDPKKVELRDGVAEERRGLFDLFAPPARTLPDPVRAPGIAEALAEAARKVHSYPDPLEALSGVRHPVHVLHGRRDHLIPFSESLRLKRALPAGTWSRVTITRLFGHSAQDPFPVLKALGEVPRFMSALGAALQLV